MRVARRIGADVRHAELGPDLVVAVVASRHLCADVHVRLFSLGRRAFVLLLHQQSRLIGWRRLSLRVRLMPKRMWLSSIASVAVKK